MLTFLRNLNCYIYRDTIIFEMKSENRNFLNNRLKDICFSTLKSYSFDKVEKHLPEVEFLALKNLTEHKDLAIQKADKGNAVVITDRTKYLEGIKSLLSDSSKFMQLPIDEDKWINYIVNLESKLKDRFKVLKNEEKFQKQNLIVFAQLELCQGFYMIIVRYIKRSLTTLQNLDLFYQQ